MPPFAGKRREPQILHRSGVDARGGVASGGRPAGEARRRLGRDLRVRRHDIVDTWIAENEARGEGADDNGLYDISSYGVSGVYNHGTGASFTCDGTSGTCY